MKGTSGPIIACGLDIHRAIRDNGHIIHSPAFSETKSDPTPPRGVSGYHSSSIESV